MSRLSNFAMEFVPHSSNFSNFRLLEYLKMGSSIFDSNNSSFSSWPEYGASTRLGLEQPKIEDNYYGYNNGHQMFSGSNFSAPALTVNESGNYFKMANFNSNNNTFPPLDFNMPDLKVAQPNPFAPNSLVTNFGRPAVCRNTQMPVASDELNFEFTNKNLESDLEAIWKDAKVDECTTRIRDFSLSSDTLTNNSHQSSSMNKSPLFKARQIVGRGAGYYQRYGTECISIPKDGPLNYPPNRKVELSSNNSAMGAFGNRDKTYHKKQWKNAQMECAFCKHISNSQDYKTHWLKNSQNVITCPVLRAYTCPICKNCGGDNPHTMRYCPLKRQKLAEDFQRTKSDSSSSKSNWQRTIKQ